MSALSVDLIPSISSFATIAIECSKPFGLTAQAGGSHATFTSTLRTATLTSLPLGKERILYIDDEPDIVAIGKQLLESLGYQVLGSTNSIEAFELFRSQPDQFDLVITDLTMPNMTGDYLARELKTIRKDIAVILCSGLSFKMSEKEAGEMGVDAVLMKPIDRADLATSVRSVLDRKIERSDMD